MYLCEYVNIWQVDHYFELLELPKLPEVDDIRNDGYDKIYLRLVSFPDDLLEYNTTIKAYELDQGIK